MFTGDDVSVSRRKKKRAVGGRGLAWKESKHIRQRTTHPEREMKLRASYKNEQDPSRPSIPTRHDSSEEGEPEDVVRRQY